MAGNEPKLADVQSHKEFPVLRPSGQGEDCGVSTRPGVPTSQAQIDFPTFVHFFMKTEFYVQSCPVLQCHLKMK